MLSPREHQKLCLLAVDRANEAITSVTRMLDDDEQALRSTIIVLMALHDTTPLQMVETARWPDGPEPSFNDCRTKVRHCNRGLRCSPRTDRDGKE
jgi:hypothetical protein